VITPSSAAVAITYLIRGWSPIPIPLRSKKPVMKGWETLILDLDDLDATFRGPANIGVRLGAASRDLVDVDIDAVGVTDIADKLLPETGAIFGRPGKPASHRLYVVSGIRTTKFADPATRRMMVEGCARTALRPSSPAASTRRASRSRG
jgi:hypothetical protein